MQTIHMNGGFATNVAAETVVIDFIKSSITHLDTGFRELVAQFAVPVFTGSALRLRNADHKEELDHDEIVEWGFTAP